MTLILALANRDHVIQLSDRRLSWNGKLVDDESNKAGVFIFNGVRAAYGFTGLARAEEFETSLWLNNVLFECAAPDFLFPNFMQRLEERANRDFATTPQLLALPLCNREVSIIFSGHPMMALFSFNLVKSALTIQTSPWFKGLATVIR
jgi:hypothetical protein